MRFELIRDPGCALGLPELYADIVAHGFGSDTPINWFTSQAGRPDILSATWTLGKAVLLKGELPATLKQLIALTISKHNNCRYCEVTHRGALEKMGVPKKVIDRCLEDPDLADVPSPHRAILKFALRVAQSPAMITDEDYAELRRNGLKQSEILEVVMTAALTNFVNTWAEATGIPVDA